MIPLVRNLFEALETKPKLKFSVEDESSVTTNEGKESDDS